MGSYINNTVEGSELTVAQIAIAYPGALAVFTKYNIDYCCGGHRSLAEACHRVGLNPEKISEEIKQTSPAESGQTFRPENWSSSFLADFIVENHHAFIRKAIPELETLLEKVCDRHGNDSMEVLQIEDAFSDLSDELLEHMQKEEIVLFPAIKRLESQQHDEHPLELMIQGPITAMEDEHVIAGNLIKKIRTLSNNYTPPEFACPTFRVTYQKLKEFDNDLMRHIHLENNILFERFKKQPAPSSCSIF